MSPKHRAEVDINMLEQIELRSRRQLRDAETKPSRKVLREEKRRTKHEHELEMLEKLSTEGLQARSVLKAKAGQQKLLRRQRSRRMMTMLTSVGIFGTCALPAYAFSPQEAAMAQFVTTNAYQFSQEKEFQDLSVAAYKSIVFDRMKVKQTSADDFRRRLLLSNYVAYRGPSASDFIKNPPFSKLNGNAIINVAKKYVGVPYVFGGENPGGFDCSGYVRFVFAQFGLDLPHSVHMQARKGIIIHKEDALPGDIVVLNDLSHDGIYAGTGMFYHAPRPGDTVKLAPIFTSEYFIVRLMTE